MRRSTAWICLPLLIASGCGGAGTGASFAGKDSSGLLTNETQHKGFEDSGLTRTALSIADSEYTGSYCVGLPPPPPFSDVPCTVPPPPMFPRPVTVDEFESLNITETEAASAAEQATRLHAAYQEATTTADRGIVDTISSVPVQLQTRSVRAPLNSAELRVIFNFRVATGTPLASVLSSIAKATAQATHHTKTVYGDGTQDHTVANAFKHALWTILLSKYLGSSFANSFTTAHEYGKELTPPGKMDIHNNGVGLSIYSSSPSQSVDFYLARLSDNVKNYPPVYLLNGVGHRGLTYLNPLPDDIDTRAVYVHANQIVSRREDVGLFLGGTPRYWKSGSPFGLHGNMKWTFTNGEVRDNFAVWRANLPLAGQYTIQVFIPAFYASSTRAKYLIYNGAGQFTEVRVNQRIFSDVWVSLGDFNLPEGTQSEVIIVDDTGERTGARWVGVDSIRFVRLGG